MNEYIKKIVVFAPDKSGGKRQQKVKIYFNFVDDVEIPVISEAITTETTYGRRERRDLRVTPFSAANRYLSLLSLEDTALFAVSSKWLTFLEAPPRLELGNRGFAVRCLTTWLWRLIQDSRAK